MTNPNAKSRTQHEAEVEANKRRIRDLIRYLVGEEATAEHDRQMSRIIPAPEWFKRRMAAVRSQPRPTFARVRQQMQASAEHRRKSTAKPR